VSGARGPRQGGGTGKTGAIRRRGWLPWRWGLPRDITPGAGKGARSLGPAALPRKHEAVVDGAAGKGVYGVSNEATDVVWGASAGPSVAIREWVGRGRRRPVYGRGYGLFRRGLGRGWWAAKKGTSRRERSADRRMTKKKTLPTGGFGPKADTPGARVPASGPQISRPTGGRGSGDGDALPILLGRALKTRRGGKSAGPVSRSNGVGPYRQAVDFSGPEPPGRDVLRARAGPGENTRRNRTGGGGLPTFRDLR